MKRIIIAGLLLSGCLTQAEAGEGGVNSLQQLTQVFRQCARIRVDSKGSEITVLFSLKRDGSLLGKPKITYSRLNGRLDDQKGFVAGVLTALSECFPLNISDGLGGAIAGRPLIIRFVGSPAPSSI